MVKVRLSRFGSRKRPYYHIVVADGESPRDGRFIEQIGTYDPARPMSEARLDRERLDYWVGVGAKVTTSLQKVVREKAKAAAAAS
ncbi:MAG: 30S ribosomal protein S16 [Myxococcales bacterium]|nr:30S ribosomal protein S16 [Myxococcales bacterium]